MEKKHVGKGSVYNSTEERKYNSKVIFFEQQASTLQAAYKLRGDVLAADMFPQASNSCLPTNLLNVMMWWTC